MKKALKIGGIILGIILVSALIIFIFFPGLFTYIKVKVKYDNIDRGFTEFKKVEVPDDFKTYTVKGITLSVPDSYVLKDTGSSFKNSDEKSVLLIMESDSLETDELMKGYSEDYDTWEYYKYEEADYKHFFETIGGTFPTPYDASSDILWFVRDKLKAKDCLKLRGRDMDVFLELADSKEESWKTEKTWELDGENCFVYIGYIEDSEIFNSDLWTAYIYDKNNLTKYHYLLFKEDDTEVIKQIISSIELK
jgi:hypothetical protein